MTQTHVDRFLVGFVMVFVTVAILAVLYQLYVAFWGISLLELGTGILVIGGGGLGFYAIGWIAEQYGWEL